MAADTKRFEIETPHGAVTGTATLIQGAWPDKLEFIKKRSESDLWGYEIKYRRADGTIGSMSGGQPAGPDNAAQVSAMALRDLGYYSTEGMRPLEIVATLACPDCGGSGEKRSRGLAPWMAGKPCKACKGEGWTEKNTIAFGKGLETQ